MLKTVLWMYTTWTLFKKFDKWSINEYENEKTLLSEKKKTRKMRIYLVTVVFYYSLILYYIYIYLRRRIEQL